MTDGSLTSASPRAAVLLLVFNRPEPTKKVFEAIRAARPPRLYVAADGPRSGTDGEIGRCDEVRKIATAVDWNCEVYTLFREDNAGCKRAVSSAITWFFENEERGIIIEDDCLPAPSFFEFCETLLDYYQNDTRVWHISGTNALPNAAKSSNEYLFSRYDFVWGWATWRRAWHAYDIDMRLWPTVHNEALLDRLLPPIAVANYTRLFSKTHSDDIDTWDYQWTFARLLNGLAIVPQANLVSNLGFGAGATHTHDAGNRLAELPQGAALFPLKHPAIFAPDPVHDAKWTYMAHRKRPIRNALVRARDIVLRLIHD